MLLTHTPPYDMLMLRHAAITLIIFRCLIIFIMLSCAMRFIMTRTARHYFDMP